mmetsp:Transcript_76122/g.202223  ORF Transcript_76122/g.202223 Transcript_76122/m.202223 type:complete len:302 (+) Transcript_76122:48-953(+)
MSGERALRRVADLHAASLQLRPDPHYLDHPRSDRSLRREQREAVVTFNTEVAEDFGLNSQTAALAINYFDRYCSALVADELPIPRERVQLISMTCLMLASKFFDRQTPSIDDMTKIAQHAYAPEEFRAQELEILGRLKWLLHVPLPHTFLAMLLRIADVSEAPVGTKGPTTTNMTKWGCILIDLSGFEYDFLKYPPLVIAYSALLCSARFEEIKSEHILAAKLEVLRRRCRIEHATIVECAKAIMAYYELCFPDSPKAEKAGFMPVQPDEREVGDRSDTTTPTSIMAPNTAFAPQPAPSLG